MHADHYLSNIVDDLNSKGPAAEELRQLVAELQGSPSLAAMMRSKGMKFASACKAAWTAKWTPSEEGRHASFVPEFNHIPEEFLQPLPRTIPPMSSGPSSKAIHRFAALALLPNCEKLAGPCARCHKYYIKKRASQKVYCSRRCGNAATAVIRTRAVLAEQHQEKLERARAAMQKWSTARTKEDWKVFVSNREEGITPKFLTRAVNKGELEVPKKARK